MFLDASEPFNVKGIFARAGNIDLSYTVPRSTLKCNTSGGGDRFSGRMMLRIGQEAATVPVMQHGRLPCPRAIAT